MLRLLLAALLLVGTRGSAQTAGGVQAPPEPCDAQDLVAGCATHVTARFVGSPTLGLSPHTVRFRDLSRGDVASRLWSFGDGATSTLANPGHTYDAPGAYTVSLTVTGRCSRSTSTRAAFVSVFDPATQPQREAPGLRPQPHGGGRLPQDPRRAGLGRERALAVRPGPL